MTLIIVKTCVPSTECSHDMWGPASCANLCDNCYNGGICDDKTGECVCRPGFMGTNCLTGT